MNKWLLIKLNTKKEDIEILLQELNDWLEKFENIEYDISEDDNVIKIYIVWSNNQTLKDYALQWKFIKELWLKYNLFNTNDYLKYFELYDIIDKDTKSNINELDKLIVKVEDNDPKLLDIMTQLKNKWKKIK